MTSRTDTTAETAHRLIAAQRDRSPIPPVRGLLADLASAYAVQEEVIATRESPTNPRVGRKVGLTSPAVQAQLGVDQPDFGVLLADMDASAWDAIPADSLIQPKIEAEVAFILGADVLAADRASVLAAVAAVVPALEIVDSRITDWDIAITDTIADNASSALYVLGATRVDPADVNPVDVVMTLRADGEVVSSGDGRACLGDPVNALVWVAATALSLGRPLRAGEVVLSGALGPMVPFTPGTRIEAMIEGLGTVSAIAAPTSPGQE